MKTKYFFMSLMLGLGLSMALLCALGGARAPSALAIVEPAGGEDALASDGELHVCPAGPPTCDYATVQAAVDAASPGAVIKVATGIYTGVQGRLAPTGYSGPAVITQVVYISKTITVRGGYTTTDWTTSNPISYPTTLDAQSKGRVAYIGPGANNTRLENLTLTGGNATDLEGFNDGGYATDAGGGVFVEGNATPLNVSGVVIAGCLIQNNIASQGGWYDWGAGGGVFKFYDDLTLVNNRIFSNTADYGGEPHGGNGGGIYLGFVWATITGNEIAHNIARRVGGGLYMHGSGMRAVRDNQFHHNQASSGGGLYAENYILEVEGNIFFANAATGQGGGGWIGGPTGSRVVNNQVYSNTAQQGGGLCLRSNGWLFERNVITGNVATDKGGGLYLDYASNSRYRNNVVAANRADSQGSGIYTWRAYNLAFEHTTIAANYGGDGTGVRLDTNYPGYVHLFTNTLVYSQAIGVNATGGDIVTMTMTLWDSVLTHTQGTVNIAFGDITGIAAFAADGYHLTADSDALDAALDVGVADDIDGQPRPMGQFADIGADEYPYYADLGLSKARQGSGPVNAGRPITFALTVNNSASSEWAADARIVDTVQPASAVAALSGSAPGGACQAAGAVITCTVNNVPTTTLTLVTVWVTTTAGYNGILTNTATVTPTDAVDLNPANNVAGPVTVTIVYAPPAPDLWVNKTASQRYIQPGQTLVYTIAWGNRGTLTAANTVLTDTLPTEVTFGSASGNPARAGQVLTWTLGSATPGAGNTYTVTVQVNGGLPDGTVLTNTARIATATAGDPPLNNTAVATTTVYQPGLVELYVTKSADVSEAEVGDAIGYAVYLRNIGARDAEVSMADDVPAGTAYIAGSAWAGSGEVIYSELLDRVYWNGRLLAGEGVTITFRVSVEDCSGVQCGILRNAATVSAAGTSRKWTPSVDVIVRCPDLTVQGSAPLLVSQYPDGFDNYEVILEWENQAAHAYVGDAWYPELVVTLPEGARFMAANPWPDEQRSPQEWVWQPGWFVAPGDSDTIRLLVQPTAWQDNGYTVHASFYADPAAECPGNAPNKADLSTWPIRMELGKEALPLKLISTPGLDAQRYQQEYVIRYRYRTTAPQRPSLTEYVIQDLWPSLWRFEQQTSQPAMTFSQSGVQAQPYDLLTWRRYYLAEGDSGWIRILGSAALTELRPGYQVTNTARARYRPYESAKTFTTTTGTTTTIPLLAPIITFPENGQLCPGPTQVRGLAQAGSAVLIYVDDVYAASTRADAQGRFTVTVDLPTEGTYDLYAVATTGLIVNSTDDDDDQTTTDGICYTGQVVKRDGVQEPECTLRAAIRQANANPGKEAIWFNFLGGYWSDILPRSPLPDVTDAVILDGSTRPGGWPVVLNGYSAGSSADGLRILAEDSTVKGLNIWNFDGHGILLLGDSNVVEQSYIGTDSYGLMRQGNRHGIGVFSANNVIRSNLISGNRIGVFFGTHLAHDNWLTGNKIGTDRSGVDNLGNDEAGILIERGDYNVIGGTGSGEGNVIAYNGQAGVTVSSTLPFNVGNRIEGNRIFANGGLGIDLGNDGVTPNDAGDGDSGPNNLQNYPRLAAVSANLSETVRTYRFTWVVNGTPNTNYYLDRYASDSPDPSGYGEGQTYLGRASVTTTASGSVTHTFTSNYPFVSLTATDPDDNTSEFSWNAHLVITRVLFVEPRYPNFNYVPVSGTVDGNTVFILVDVYNPGGSAVAGTVRLVDDETNRPLPGEFVAPAASDQQTFAARQVTQVKFQWSTFGFAWENSQPHSQRKIRVEIVQQQEGQPVTIQGRGVPIKVLPRPAILVHGWNSSAATWSAHPGFLRSVHPDWRGYAVGDGQAPGVMNTGSFTSFGKSILENAHILRTYIDGVRRQTNAWHVDIVAHSKGGLISREYIHGLMAREPDGQPSVIHLIMLGTPNAGSSCADVGAAYSAGFYELMRDFVADFNREVYLTNGVHFAVMAGDPLLYTCIESSRGDSVVSIDSAFKLAYVTDLGLADTWHTSMPGSWPDFYAFVKPRLAQDPTQFSALGAAPDRWSVMSEPSSDPQLAYMGMVTLPVGVPVDVDLQAGEALTLGVTLATSEHVTATLRDPNNNVVGVIAANSREAKQIFRSLRVTNPLTGIWRLRLENQGTAATQASVSAWLHGNPLLLDLTVGEPDVTGSVLISVTLTNSGAPVTGAVVTAELYRTDGVTTSLTLYDDGAHGDGSANDGRYAGATSPLSEGDYTVLARARGTGFDRATTGVVRVVSADLALSKGATPQPARTGQPLTYTLVVSNSGPSDAVIVMITDTLPGGVTFHSVKSSLGGCSQASGVVTCTMSLVSSGQVSVTLVVTPTAAGIITNTAHVWSGATDPNPANNTAIVGTIVITGSLAAMETPQRTSDSAAALPALNVASSNPAVHGNDWRYSGPPSPVSNDTSGSVAPSVPRPAASPASSARSNVVTVNVINSGWCPQRSYWTGIIQAGPLQGQRMTFFFRDQQGRFSTQDWVINGVYGFWNTDLYLYACGCEHVSAIQTITVTADGTSYVQSGNGSPQTFHLGPIASNHQVQISTRCSDDPSPPPSSHGVVLIDPDGYVFNVDKGGAYSGPGGMFAPVQPVSGVTVTCMVSMPQWGGWVPWPAHVYGQTNPQVTDATFPDGITTPGYFAFFTPPGQYYLQVEGIPGYQEWRSPVVEVITQIVHVNVPYTPWVGQIDHLSYVTLTADGPTPAVVTVPVGGAVEWISTIRASDTITDLLNWFENPIVRPLSDLDPLRNPRGFDAGYLEPGRVYRRQFKLPGRYAYTDASGHSGVVIVEGPMIYLPIVFKH